MMLALHRGGLGAVYAPDSVPGSKEINGYNPNPSGIWEVGRQYYMNAHFLRSLPDGCLIKILFDGLVYLPQRDYKIIFMLRDEQDIQDSVERAECHLRATGVPENTGQPTPFDVYLPYNQKNIDHVVNICEVRADMQLTKVHFNDLVDDPVGTLESLELPIDIQKAAAEIDPKHRRFNNDRSSRRDAGVNPRTADSTSPT
jgi:hypothetical protein